MSTQECRETRIKRLRYRSWHRGCKETDEILGHFCEQHVESMTDADLSLFEAFIEEDDDDIWKWLIEKRPVTNPAYEPFLDAMRNYKSQNGN
ncbi:MAG: succinate dehydrogenase assembly factor 2 [Rickettsiales bacterium]|nr:succinate dehydrogenase assembly factor 2 [Rickettsiales bacterium]